MSPVSPQPQPKRNGLQLIARAADVLRGLEYAPGGVSLSELSLSVGLPKSTVHRLLGALEQEDLVGVGPGGRWRLGRGLARLGAAARSALREELRPCLIRLAQQVEETVDLSILDGSEARFIDQIPSPQRLAAVSAVGIGFPLHCTANGKALLAAMPPDQAAAILPPRLACLTPNTITSRHELWAELERVRATGVAYDRDEHTAGICAVGAVVYDSYGIAGAISIPVPAQRFDDEEEVLTRHLRTACAAASESLGGGGPRGESSQ